MEETSVLNENHSPSHCLTLQEIWIQNILMMDAGKSRVPKELMMPGMKEVTIQNPLFGALGDFIPWDNAPLEGSGWMRGMALFAV